MNYDEVKAEDGCPETDHEQNEAAPGIADVLVREGAGREVPPHIGKGHKEDAPNTVDGKEKNSLDGERCQSVRNGDNDDFPEGGLRAWLAVFGSFSAMFVIFGIINSSGALLAYFSSNQLRDNSPEQIAWIFSLELFVVFFCGIYAGGIFDAHGPRELVAVGTVLLVLSMMLLSVCTGTHAFLFSHFKIVW